MLAVTTHIETDNSSLWTVVDYNSDYFDEANELPLEHRPAITVFGKQGRQNRDVGFFSDTSIGYRYSGTLMRSKPASDYPLLTDLLSDVNHTVGANFNGVLVNRYVGGNDYLGAHSDDESALDKLTKAVAAISYGATRTFRIRDKHSKKIVLDLPMTSGMLLVMDGDFQSEFTHEIPTQAKVKGTRISLTFRHHLQ